MTIGRLTHQLLCTTSIGAHHTRQAPDVGRSVQQPKRKKSNKYLSLEPRMMFDGALAATAIEAAFEVGDLTFDGAREATNEDRRLFDALLAPTETVAAYSVPQTTIAFIDSTVAETICDRMRRKNVKVWLIKKGCDAHGSVCLV